MFKIYSNLFMVDYIFWISLLLFINVWRSKLIFFNDLCM